MFCTHCGTKIRENGKFCQACGYKTKTSEAAKAPIVAVLNSEAKLYSTDWRKVKTLAAFSLPYFDILIDKNNLYLIKLPTYSSAGVGLLIGLFVLNIIGAIIGHSIGKSMDLKDRARYRSKWIDADSKLTSQDFEKNIFLKIPLADLQPNVSFTNNKLIINYSNVKITLKKSKSELLRISEYFNSNVLPQLRQPAASN